MKNEFVDFQGQDSEAENDTLDCKRLNFVAPSQKPNCIDVHEEKWAYLDETEHGEDEEWADQCFEPVLACSIEPWFASQLTEEEAAEFECEYCTDA